MNTPFKTFVSAWKSDRVRTGLWLCWLATVAASFGGPYFLPVTIPLAGTLYLFRLLLPVTALLYLVWALRGNDHFWKDSSALEKWVYVLIGVMLVYGAVSLVWAISFAESFRMLFNLCFDLCFFFLMLRLCRNEKLRRLTLNVCYIMLAVMCVLGIYEIFCGGLVNTHYDSARCQDFTFFLSNYQYPVVFCGNTNDFALMLTSLYAVFLLDKLSGKILNKWDRAALVILGAAIYFLLLATSSRFCKLAYVLLLAAFALWAFFARRERRTLLALLLCIGCLWFSNQYRYLVHHAPKVEQSLTDQFWEIEEETGEAVLRSDGSAGIRSRLLLHALDCFLDSRGLGVGLGNTGVLAAERTIIPRWAGEDTVSIHCFIARIIADYGVFVLIPLCVIAFLLLRRIWEVFRKGCKEKDRTMIAGTMLLFGCAVIYPLVSSASSDAQDNIPMWIYLAGVVVFTEIQSAAKQDNRSA